jgi:hypothetical protein
LKSVKSQKSKVKGRSAPALALARTFASQTFNFRLIRNSVRWESIASTWGVTRPLREEPQIPQMIADTAIRDGVRVQRQGQ